MSGLKLVYRQIFGANNYKVPEILSVTNLYFPVDRIVHFRHNVWLRHLCLYMGTALNILATGINLLINKNHAWNFFCHHKFYEKLNTDLFEEKICSKDQEATKNKK